MERLVKCIFEDTLQNQTVDTEALKDDSQGSEEQKDSPAKMMSNAMRLDPNYEYLKNLEMEIPKKFKKIFTHLTKHHVETVCKYLSLSSDDSFESSPPRKVSRTET